MVVFEESHLVNCQQNMTVVFVTLSLNNLGFGDKLRHNHINFWFFATAGLGYK